MEVENRYDGVDEYAIKFITFKANQLVGTAGFTKSDVPDLEQELMFDLHRRLPRFDRSKAKKTTFIARVVEHRIATILEERKAGKRDYRRVGHSLNERIDYGEGDWSIEKSANVDQEDYWRQRGCSSRSLIEIGDLGVDLAVLLENLPEDLRDLCLRLTRQTITEVSKETGVPRSTIYDALKRIRNLFESAGLREYL